MSINVPFQLRTEIISNVLASKLNTNQLKFIMYLYRITVECKRLETKIPSLNRIADILLVDRRNFRRDVAELIERSIILREGKEYGFNIDFDIIGKSKRLSACKRLLNKAINTSVILNDAK